MVANVSAAANGEWPECLVPPVPHPPELERFVAQHMGAVPAWLGRLAPVPWVAQTMARIHGPVAHIDQHLCEYIGMVVSRDNSCRYCFGIQRALFKILGYHEALITALERDFHTAAIAPEDRVALEFARRLSRADPRPGAIDRDELARAGFSPPAIAEIAFTAAAGVYANRVATLLALPPEPLEQEIERPLFRFIRPLVALRMRARPRPKPAPAVIQDGPFARVVDALTGSPAAATLRTAIDDALASPVLPRRTKALMLAVVARALGCASGEDEARIILSGDGYAAADVDDVLRHLGSPRLSVIESRLVPFARDSVRYQTAVIQARMHEACDGLSTEETIETVGVLALGNALSRLTILLDAC
jgi:alkylhydroperoxidase family enzyme